MLRVWSQFSINTLFQLEYQKIYIGKFNVLCLHVRRLALLPTECCCTKTRPRINSLLGKPSANCFHWAASCFHCPLRVCVRAATGLSVPLNNILYRLVGLVVNIFHYYSTTSVAQRFIMWALDERAPDSILNKTNTMENYFVKFFSGLNVLGSAPEWMPMLWYL